MRHILAALLVTALLVAPIAFSAQAGGEYTFNAQIGEQSKITTQFNIVLDTPTNTTGTVTVYYNNQTGEINAEANLNGNLSLEGVNLTITGSGVYDFVNGNYTETYEFHLRLEASNITGGSTGFQPAQEPPFGGSPPMVGVSTPQNITVTLDVTGSEKGYVTVNESYREGTLQADLYIENGAYYFNLQGDIVANLSASYKAIVERGKAVVQANVTVNFNSGNATVDSFLAGALNTMIQMMAGNMGGQADASITSQLVNNTAVYIQLVATGKVTNATFNATVVPKLENATAHIVYQFNLDLNDDGTFTLTASANGNVNAPGLFESLPTAPTYVDLNVNIDNTTITGNLEIDTYGDPTAAFALAKALLLAEAKEVKRSGSLTATLTAEGGYTFVLFHNGRVELGSQVTFTEDNATLVKHLYLEPPGVDYESKGEGMLVVKLEPGAAHGKAELGFDAFAESKVLEVEGKGVVVNVGSMVVSEEKVIVVNASDAQAKVKLLPGTTVNGTLEVEALSQQEAEANASAYGYQAAGDGVKVDGVANGTVEIAVKGDVQAAQEGRLAILEISADGSVKLITDVQVNGSMIVFATSSFSTFVPVYTESGQTGGGTTTTTTTTTSESQTTTTTTTQTGREETTTETTTTTTTKAGTTTTTTEEEKEESYTTSETPEMTSQQAGAEETTTQTGGATTAGQGGGVSNTAIAAIAIIIIIAAAALVLSRR